MALELSPKAKARGMDRTRLVSLSPFSVPPFLIRSWRLFGSGKRCVAAGTRAIAPTGAFEPEVVGVL